MIIPQNHKKDAALIKLCIPKSEADDYEPFFPDYAIHDKKRMIITLFITYFLGFKWILMLDYGLS